MAIALIMAGGIGSRMKENIPKQFLKINQKPIIIHTIQKFEDNKLIDEIVITCLEGFHEKLWGLIKEYKIKKVSLIVNGGQTGLESTYNALKKLYSKNKTNPVVLIHDAVRPFVNDAIINKNVDNVLKHGSSITCAPVTEPLFTSKNQQLIDKVYDRSNFFYAKAPQAFYLNDILNAHKKERQINKNYHGIYDSSTLMVKNGHSVYLNIGDNNNLKITDKNDLLISKTLLNQE